MKKLLFSAFFAPFLVFFSFYPSNTPSPYTPPTLDGTAFFYNTPTLEGTLPIGSPIPKPDVRVKDVSGKELSLQEVKQPNGLLVMFSCNTCPYVIMNQSRTKEICTYAGNRKIGVILLNANEGDRQGGNSLAEMQAYAKSQAYQWYYAVDNNSVLADAFGASRTPECYLFDTGGKLVYHGAIDDSPANETSVNRHHLQNAIDEMIGGKDVSVKETRSVGCAIKRI